VAPEARRTTLLEVVDQGAVAVPHFPFVREVQEILPPHLPHKVTMAEAVPLGRPTIRLLVAVVVLAEWGEMGLLLLGKGAMVVQG
jgi:hypothetical protein